MRTSVSMRAIAAAFAFAVVASPVAAQDGGEANNEPAEVSQSHLEAGRAAIDAINATDQFDAILPNAATQIKAELIPNNPDREDAISEMVDERAIALASRRGALETEVARAYAQIFSEAELRQIADFYNSEAGQKLLNQGPRATQETMAAAEVWRNGIMRDLRQQSLEGVREMVGGGGQGAQPNQ